MKKLLIILALVSFSSIAKPVSISLTTTNYGCVIDVINTKTGQSGDTVSPVDCKVLASMMVKQAKHTEEVSIILNGVEVMKGVKP